jgi:nitroreductase
MSKEIGRKIKDIRQKRGMSQQEFAESLGYTSRSTICKIEDGEVEMSYEKLLKLINDYSLSFDELISTNKQAKRPINKRMDEDKIDYMELVGKRYSLRNFSDKQVEKEKLESILKAGQLAPTAHNNQPQRIYVLQSREALEKLQRCKMSHYGETLALLVCADTNACWKRDYDGKSSGDIDAAIVTTYMMLAAQELGIGSTWVMHFIPEAVKEEFGIPKNEEPVSLLVMGYASVDSKPSPLHVQRKDLKEIVKIL